MTHPTQEASQTGILLSLVITILAPMFLAAAGGDIQLAQHAAIEAIGDYRTNHDRGLVAIAQIIAFGLAALGSLSHSMQQDLSVSATLRLRGNANALSRSAEQNRRALGPVTLTPKDEQAVKPAAAPVTSPEPPPPAVPRAQPTAAPISPRDADRQHRTACASAISDVAAEFTASLPFLPPAERKLTARKIATMSTSVAALLSNDPLPRSTRSLLGPLLKPA